MFKTKCRKSKISGNSENRIFRVVRKLRFQTKGQVAVTDLFIALFIATILIVVIILTWNKYVRILGEDNDFKQTQIAAFQAADLLVKSPGYPADWEDYPETLEVIGLASSDRNLSVKKVDALINNITIGNSSKALGLHFYDFYLQLKHINGTLLMEYGDSNMPNRSIVSVQRLVMYKNEKTVVELALWK